MQGVQRKTPVSVLPKTHVGHRTLNKKNLFTLAAILCALAGVALLLVRPVGILISDHQHQKAINEYVSAVNSLSQEQLQQIKQRAIDYNEFYATARPYIWPKSYGWFKKDYPTELSVPGTDVIAYIEIPGIGANLPIYRYSTDKSMNRGCGHYECSSLPVGGADSHTVIMSHRNMLTSVTFERLDELKPGDTFSITVLDEKATFEVDSIRVVRPNRVEDYIDDRVELGKQLCTLVTCTPDISNTHRLFVRGVRIS